MSGRAETTADKATMSPFTITNFCGSWPQSADPERPADNKKAIKGVILARWHARGAHVLAARRWTQRA